MTTTVAIAAEDLLTELVAEGCDPTLVSSLIDSMMYAGLNLDQNDDGPALLDGGEAELIREQAEAARDARWVVCIDTLSDLRDGGDDPVVQAYDRIEAGEDEVVVDGVTMTADNADDMLGAYLEAYEAAWIAAADQLGHDGRVYDGPIGAEARQANERTGQLRGITDDEDVFDLVNAAANATWAAVERPVLDQLV